MCSVNEFRHGTDNYFGKSSSEFAWIVDQNKIIVNDVSEAGGIIINAGQPLDKVVDDILNEVHSV
jgi:hypothetical protein